MGIDLNKIYKNKKVLITGNTGFKGSWLMLWLKQLGADVSGYSIDVPTKPALFDLLNLPVKTIWGDITDYKGLKKTFDSFKPEIVFHLAAQPLVRASYKNPVETFQVNTTGTINILEVIRNSNSVKAAVLVTTDKVYLNKEIDYAYTEEDSLGGYDPYSASKAAAEIAISSYRSSFFKDKFVASVRAGNVIGGGDFAEDRLIPDFIRAYLNSDKIIVRNPRAIRPWQHVLEPIYGYLLIGGKLLEEETKFAAAWNFGPEDADAKPVEWIVKNMCEKLHHKPGFLIDKSVHPHEAHYLKLNSEKAKKNLKWKPVWNLDYALSKTVEWVEVYKNNPKKIKDICLKQITEYVECLSKEQR